MGWLQSEVDAASAPTLLCEDARDLAYFPRLNFNVVVTSLWAFAVTDAVDPGARVEHWMLRLADPSGKGRGPGFGLRSSLDTLRATPIDAGWSRDPRSLSAAELRAFISGGTLPEDALYFRRSRSRWKSLSSAIAELRLRSGDDDEGDALFARTGTALVRYVATIGNVFGALFDGRGRRGGVAILEVPDSQVRDLKIDTPSIVDEYLRVLGLVPLAGVGAPSRRRKRLESQARTEPLAYRF